MRGAFFGLFAAATSLFAACSSDSDLSFGSSQSTSASSGALVCAAGSSQACACTDGSQGAQTCKADGSGFGACSCDGTGGNGNAGGAGAMGGSGGGEGGSSRVCDPGSMQDCYSGPNGTLGVGLCVAGTQICAPDGMSFGPCVGEVVPDGEVCSTPGDDDCDGQTNEDGPDCACSPGSQAPCYSGPPTTEDVGPCHGGTQQCKPDGTGYGPCVGEVTPGVETCTTPGDDDCDGATNEEGTGCVCAPNATAPCYEGPPNTENVGPCTAGTHTCNNQGTAWGPCSGQVLPGVDLCSTPIDDDCSGSTADCVVSSGPWSKTFGTPTNASGIGLTIDSSGNVLLLAACSVNTDLGGGPLATNPCLGKFTGAGAHVWSKSAHAGAWQGDIATDSAGSYIWAGGFKSFIDLGGAVLSVNDPNYAQSFVVKFAADGTHLWSKSIGDPLSHDIAYDVATDPVGNVFVLGGFQGSFDVGTGPLTSLGADDLYLVKYSPSGVPLWSKAYGTPSAPEGQGFIATDSAGNLYLHVSLWATLDYGGGPLVPNGQGSVAIVKLDPQGNHVWSKACTGAPSGMPTGLELDGAGNLLLTGTFASTFDCGGTPLAGGAGNTYAVKLDPSGNYVWGLAPALTNPSMSIEDVTTDAAGNVYLTGSLAGVADFAGTILSANGGTDVFMVQLSPGGAVLQAHKYGDVGGAVGHDIGVDATGAVFLTGEYSSAIDFGSGSMSPAPNVNPAAFLARLP